MSKKTKKLTPKEAEKLKPILDKLGFEIKTVYEVKCELCGKKFTSKDEKRLNKRLGKHIDKECPVARWMRGTTEILKMMGLKNIIMADLIYLQKGEFPRGCERTKSEELEILNRVKNLLIDQEEEEK